MLCSENLIGKEESIYSNNGSHIAPDGRSVTDILDNEILESFCSSLFFFNVVITNALKRTATGEMIEAKAANIQGDMVSCASHYLLRNMRAIKH